MARKKTFSSFFSFLPLLRAALTGGWRRGAASLASFTRFVIEELWVQDENIMSSASSEG